MNDDARAAFATRHERFRSTLGQRRQLIAERWTELRMVRWSRHGADQLRSWVRELADQATEFGYPALGEMAREMQNRVAAIIGDYPPFKELLGGVTASLERMNLQIDRIQQMGAVEIAHSAAPSAAAAAQAPPTLLLATGDPESSALVTTVARSLGLEVEPGNDMAALAALPGKAAPALLVIDEPTLDRVTAQSGAKPQPFGDLPWLLLARHPHIELRYRALALGASACLSEPLDLHELTYALRLASLPHWQQALNVQIVADTPEMAERHAEVLREAGLTPLLGAELARLPDVLAGQAAQAMLLDLNLDAQQRDLWLNLMADTPGFDCLPVVCLNVQRGNPDSRHRRTHFIASPAPRRLLPLALRRAVLENERDAWRLARDARIREDERTCTPELLISRLGNACAAAQDDPRQSLLLLTLDEPLPLLEAQGPEALQTAQQQLELALLESLDAGGCCCRDGSLGLLGLVAGTADPPLREFLARLETRLRSRAPVSAHAVLLPLRGSPMTASEALRRVGDAMQALRREGKARFRLLSAEPAKRPEPPRSTLLPTPRMRLQVRPLVDAEGKPQALHDASIHLAEVDGIEPPLSGLIATVVENGLATQLDLWEMHAAVDHLCALPETTRGLEISMRLSTASRESAMLVPVVRGALAKLPQGRGFRLVFEVQESWLVDHNAIAVEMVEGLRGLGCGVMLGDFGGTDNPRNVAWASWFDFARLSERRLKDFEAGGDAATAADKLTRTAASRGARIIAGNCRKRTKARLAECGVALFEADHK